MGDTQETGRHSRDATVESTRRARLVRAGIASWLACLAMLCGPCLSQARASEPSDEVLVLLAEQSAPTSGDNGAPAFWWSAPTEPQWTETDRELMRALDQRGMSLMEPTSDVRISRIYQRPDLSKNNAAALASVLGARRVVTGRVTYRRTETLAPVGLAGMEVRASMRILDVTASEPEVLRRYELERRVYLDRTRSQSSEMLLERARAAIAPPVAELLDQTLSIVSGRVGVDAETPLLRFYGLERSGALERIRTALKAVGDVEEVAVRWAAEGVIALRVESKRSSGPDLMRRASNALRSHTFEALTLKPRSTPETSDVETTIPLAFDVRVTGSFERDRRKTTSDAESEEPSP